MTDLITCHRPGRWQNPDTGRCEHPDHDGISDSQYVCENGDCPELADVDANVLDDQDVWQMMYLCDGCFVALSDTTGVAVEKRVS